MATGVRLVPVVLMLIVGVPIISRSKVAVMINVPPAETLAFGS